MEHLLSLPIAQLEAWFRSRGHPVYRAAQVLRWVFKSRVTDWEQMTDLGRSLRQELARHFQLWTTRIAQHTHADDGTEKVLLALADGQTIEAVLLRDRVRHTLCISTQVGCGMGCVFCASGMEGLIRNLSTGEIVEQMLRLQRLLRREERVSHIVVMGMGEPLANLNGLLPALQLATGSAGLGVSARRVTISTVGLPKAIRRLAREAPEYRLALSLHAPNDSLRNQIVPTNRTTGLAGILAAADAYYRASRRRLTFEYVLLRGINDRPEHAHQLARLLARRTALVNLIPCNPVSGRDDLPPRAADQREFHRILRQHGLQARFRHRKGQSINAACGQLRRALETSAVNRDETRIGCAPR